MAKRSAIDRELASVEAQIADLETYRLRLRNLRNPRTEAKTPKKPRKDYPLRDHDGALSIG